VPRRRAALGALALLAACGGAAGRSGPATTPPPSEPSTTSPSAAAAGGYGPPVVLGQVDDPAIPESSGLVASRRNPGLLWTHNDSGDGPFVYCLDRRAAGCGVWRLTGAEAVDWEDIAAGPGPRPGEPYLYVGDIGDNGADRSSITVYRVVEPAVSAGGGRTRSAASATAPAEALRLRYPDGAHDAEALLVHPTTGDVYVVTKGLLRATVFKASAPLSPAAVTTMTAVASLSLGVDVVTGGDISPDGRRVALSAYGSGLELELPAAATSFDAVWSQQPSRVNLGLRRQGEAVAYRLDGRALLTTSEGSSFPLQEAERR
jgi:hypothetical protein